MKKNKNKNVTKMTELKIYQSYNVYVICNQFLPTQLHSNYKGVFNLIPLLNGIMILSIWNNFISKLELNITNIRKYTPSTNVPHLNDITLYMHIYICNI